MSKNRQYLPTPTKDLFEVFIYSGDSSTLQTIPNRIKDTKKKKRPPLFMTALFISVYKYMFWVMYRNRINKDFSYQEICNLSNATIAKWSRTSINIVKDAIYYGIQIGLLHSISQGGRKKGIYAPGQLLYKLYPQNLSTSENLGWQPPQFKH